MYVCVSMLTLHLTLLPTLQLALLPALIGRNSRLPAEAAVPGTATQQQHQGNSFVVLP